MARYVLLGGTMAFIGGKRIDLYEEFELPDDVRPPKFAKKLEEGEVPPSRPDVPVSQPTMSELSGGSGNRDSDGEPV